jgi:hypothetical protein
MTVKRPRCFRVRLDPESWPMIPGRLGRIEYHDGREPAVYSNRPRVFGRLWALPGIRRWQVGDQEVRGLLPAGLLEVVARLVGAKRRRSLAPEAARQKGARTAYRATSAA